MKDLQSNKASDFGATIGKTMISFAEKLTQWGNWWREHEAQICKYIEVFSFMAVYYHAIDKLIHNNAICTYDLNRKLAEQIVESSSVEGALKSYYFNNEKANMKVLLSRCQNGLARLQRDALFTECVSSYNRSEYHLALIGVYALADGVLADSTSNPRVTNFKTRLLEIQKRINGSVPLSEYDWRLLSLSAALDKFEYSPFNNSDFAGAEPLFPHRHWLLHGRTHNNYTEYDFLLAILWLDAMLFFAEVLHTLNEGDTCIEAAEDAKIGITDQDNAT